MNDLFQAYLLTFIKIYLDDIIAHSKTFTEHLTHLKAVFKILRANKLYCKREKCFFCFKQIDYCGFIVSEKGIAPQKKKLQAITDWPTPKDVTDVRSFIGLCGFYRKFIKAYATLVTPLTDLLKKDKTFSWTTSCKRSFESLKQAFIDSTILAFPDPNKTYFLYTDASDKAIGATLNQTDDEGNLRLLACFSKKLNDAEQNYPNHEKELFALIQSLTSWRHYLLGCSKGVICFTDNTAVSWIYSHRRLSRRQARWLELLEEFMPYITLKHIKGEENTAADALSRLNPVTTRTNSSEDDDKAISVHSDSSTDDDVPITQPHVVDESSGRRIPLSLEDEEIQDEKLEDVVVDKTIQQANSDPEWLEAYQNDSTFNNYFDNTGTVKTSEMTFHQGYFWDEDRIRVPKDLVKTIMEQHHTSPVAGHFGTSKTLDLIRRKYSVPHLRTKVKTFVKACDVCQRNKPERKAQRGVLQQKSVPPRPWHSIALDWIDRLPESRNHNTRLLVIVDRLTKRVRLIPTKHTDTATDFARVFLTDFVRHYGLPRSIHSDREKTLLSEFWQSYCLLTGIKHKPTTAFHPSANG
jgi:hypothetical protein